jgi:hypothetical protein
MPGDLDGFNISVHVSRFDIVSCVFLIYSELSSCSLLLRDHRGMVSERLDREL